MKNAKENFNLEIKLRKPFNKKISTVRLHEKTVFKISLSNPPKNGDLKRFRAFYEVFEIQNFSFFIVHKDRKSERILGEIRKSNCSYSNYKLIANATPLTIRRLLSGYTKRKIWLTKGTWISKSYILNEIGMSVDMVGEWLSYSLLNRGPLMDTHQADTIWYTIFILFPW